MEKGEKRIKFKQGIWFNRIKMRKIIDKISLYYGFILAGVGAVNLINGNYYQAIFEIIMSLPLWIIQWSKLNFDKTNKNEVENGEEKE